MLFFVCLKSTQYFNWNIKRIIYMELPFVVNVSCKYLGSQMKLWKPYMENKCQINSKKIETSLVGDWKDLRISSAIHSWIKL